MAITYSLLPLIKWYIVDNVGRPAGSGQIETFSSLNKTQHKPVFQDPAGQIPYNNPIDIDENGTKGPIYGSFDSANPNDLYYIRTTDADGNLLWDADDVVPGGGGSGGSVITEAISLQNLIVNNVFYRNIGTSQTPLPSFLKIAPSIHEGFSASSPPDIFFVKSNLNATDQITFPQFTLGSNELSPDVTPVDYLNYTCTAIGAGGEISKFFGFPITAKVQNLSNQTVSISLWARANSGANTLDLSWYQFFGDGVGASLPQNTPIQTLNLTNVFQLFQITTVIPDVTPKTLGSCGNDVLYFFINLPLSQLTSLDIVKPFICLGDILPTAEFVNYDEINAIISSPRTGDFRISLNDFSPFGWVPMNDGTIGNSGSNSTTRQNIDTFPLFNLLWNSFAGNQALAPMFTSAGAPIVYGVSSAADFTAGNQLSLTKQLGRVISSVGLASSGGLTTWQKGQIFGEEKHTPTIAEMASHDHPGSLAGVGSGVSTNTISNNGAVNTGSATLSIATQGGGQPFNVIQPTSFMNFFMKL